MSHFHLDDETYEDIPNHHGCESCPCNEWKSKIKFFIIRGGMSVEQKEREKKAFIECSAPAVCLLSTKAAGEAIDGLQFATSKMYVLEMQWNMAEIRQLEKRIHRTGQTKSCQIEYSVCIGTIDEFFWQMSKMKEKIATSVEDENFESI
jgi:SNF2 family DNA or RNA helicase